MAKQDDFVRITLRLPRDLHESLTQAAGARSLNAEIVSRLEALDGHTAAIMAASDREKRLLELISHLRDALATLEKQAETLADIAKTYAGQRNELELRVQKLEKTARSA